MPNLNSSIVPQIFVGGRGRKAASRPGRRDDSGGPSPGVASSGAMSMRSSPSSAFRAIRRAASIQRLRAGFSICAARVLPAEGFPLSFAGVACRGCCGCTGAGGGGCCRRTCTDGTAAIPRPCSPGAVRKRKSTSRCAAAESASARDKPVLMARPCSCFRSLTCAFWQRDFTHCRKPPQSSRRTHELPAHHAARRRP